MNSNHTTNAVDVIETASEELQSVAQELQTGSVADVSDLGEELEPAVKPRLLDFTVVSGHLRGDHACPFELHATGCRDLNQLKRLGLWSFNVYAESRESAVPVALDELGGVAKAADIWVQPCCTLKRMKAIGRA